MHATEFLRTLKFVIFKSPVSAEEDIFNSCSKKMRGGKVMGVDIPISNP